MDVQHYIKIFNSAVQQTGPKPFDAQQLLCSVGLYMDSVCLKLYKKEWANEGEDPLHSKSRIFFSIWVNDETLKKGEIRYNIHALKLRQLRGYKISSRNFAADFRKKFKDFESFWPHVRTDYGPLTLMEGWQKAEERQLKEMLLELMMHFLKTAHLVDETLQAFKA